MSAEAKPKPDLILHVGFNKTGSSSIQETFSRLQFDDLAYATWGGANHTGSFLHAFVDDKSIIYGVGDSPVMQRRAEANGARLHRELVTFLAACKAPRILISAEAMSAKPYEDSLVRFADFIRPQVRSIKVIGYVRPAADLSASRFQQVAKMGGMDKLPSVVLNRANIMMLERVFGVENVTLVKFDRDTLYKNDVVLDFAHRIGVEVKPDQIIVANESVSLEAVSVLHCHRTWGLHGLGYPMAAKVQMKLVDILAPLGSTPFRYSQVLVDQFEEKMAEDTKWVEARLGVSMKSKPRSGGIGSEAEILTVAAACETALVDLVSAMPGARAALAERDKDAPAPQRIAALVDIVKDCLRFDLDHQVREAG